MDPFLAVADTAAKQGPYVAGSGRVNVMNGRDRFCGTRVDPAMTFGYAAGRLTSGVIDGEIVSELQNDGV